jgi:4-amino-4-deoxy-L-arabinose transferase-like glycosyltransferase
VGWLALRFFARQVNARAAFWLMLVVTAAPLMAAGSVLMTIDPLSVLFWTAAMIAGWRAVQSDGRVRDWFWAGLWMGLGFLSKYTALLQWLSLLVFSCLWPTARRQWRRPGPYLALLVNAACALPVLLWNSQHDWITLVHLRERAGLGEAWRPTARFLLDFTGSEAALLNPVFFGGMLWAAVAVWRKRRHDPFLTYLLSMGAPLFILCWLYTLRARVQPNWIAPAVLPLFCVMVAHADSRWRAGVKRLRGWLAAGLALGLPAVLLLHDTNLVGKMIGTPLPAEFDPLRRLQGWRQMAQVVGEARQALLAEGKPAFVIGEHYGISGLLSFYLPEAKAGVPARPLVYCLSSDYPVNQFGLWPGYSGRKGQNAIYVQYFNVAHPPPERLVREFGSVTDLGIREVVYRGRVLRRVQLLACHDLR